jgi:hypothetical protein
MQKPLIILRRKIKKAFFFGIFALFLLYISPFNYLLPGYSLFFGSADYEREKARSRKKIEHLKKRYGKENAPFPKEMLLEARDSLLEAFDRNTPYWFGTKYDFNGTSQTPQRGKIACGFFVSGVLADIGFRIDKKKFGRMGSEQFIRKLIDKKFIRRYAKTSNEKFWEAVEKMPDGLFVVGLDTHIGFLRKKGGNSEFIHASSLGQACVLSESAKQSRTLSKSKLKVVGLLSEDFSRAIPAWVENKKQE